MGRVFLTLMVFSCLFIYIHSEGIPEGIGPSVYVACMAIGVPCACFLMGFLVEVYNKHQPRVERMMHDFFL